MVLDPKELVEQEKLYSDIEAAKAADLVVYPDNIPEGANCSNCDKYYQDGKCLHKWVSQTVKPDWVCKFWDADGVYRPWTGKNEVQKTHLIKDEYNIIMDKYHIEDKEL